MTHEDDFLRNMQIKRMMKRFDGMPDDDLDPCIFYGARYNDYHRCVMCDNQRTRGFKNCPNDKRRCYKDMLVDIFDFCKECYGEHGEI